MNQPLDQLPIYPIDQTQSDRSLLRRVAIASALTIAGAGVATLAYSADTEFSAAGSTDPDATAELGCGVNGDVSGWVTAYKHREDGVFTDKAGNVLGSAGAEKSQTSEKISLGRLLAGSSVFVVFNEVPITNVTERLKHIDELVAPDCDKKEVTTTTVKPDVSTIVPPSEAPKGTTTTIVPKNVPTTFPVLPTPTPTPTTTPPSTEKTLPKTMDYKKVPKPVRELPVSTGNNL